MFLPGENGRKIAVAAVASLRAMRTLLAFAAVLALGGCGGGSDGGPLFERAERALRRADALGAHVRISAPVPLERTATIPASDLPLHRLQLTRWAEHPHRFDCGDRFECARADLDVDAAARELEDLLPPLPLDPRALGEAHVAVRFEAGGELRRVELDGEAYGVEVRLELRPVKGRG